MENEELFDKIHELIKTNFGKKFRLKILSMDKNFFDDLSEIYIEKLEEGGINSIIRHTTFRELKEQFDKVGLEKALANIKEFLSDDMKIIDADPLLLQALKLCIEADNVSTAFIQRKFIIGYPRAARMVDQMECLGFITGEAPRKILITKEEFAKRFGDVKVELPKANDQKKPRPSCVVD